MTDTFDNWETICSVDTLVDGTGVCALHNGEQVAIFKVKGELYALSNYDPFGKANVLSRGLIGSEEDTIYIASPLYKQRFSLSTGACLDDPETTIPQYQVRAHQDKVQLKI